MTLTRRMLCSMIPAGVAWAAPSALTASDVATRPPDLRVAKSVRAGQPLAITTAMRCTLNQAKPVRVLVDLSGTPLASVELDPEPGPLPTVEVSVTLPSSGDVAATWIFADGHRQRVVRPVTVKSA